MVKNGEFASMNKLALAVAVVGVTWVAQAEKSVYQVTTSGESGIDLTALGGGYCQDRFAGPSASGEVHVTGEVKYVLEPGGALGIIRRPHPATNFRTGLTFVV